MTKFISSLRLWASIIRLIFAVIQLTIVSSVDDNNSFYTGMGVDFLEKFGYHYDMLQRFFGNKPFIKPKQSIFSDIGESYRIADHEGYYLNASGFGSPGGSYDSSADLKYPQFSYPTKEYNDRYRFGNKLEDRFMYIGVPNSKDPWIRDSSVFFIGNDVGLDKNLKYYCEFTYPVATYSIVTVLDGFRDAVNRPTKENIVSCPIPSILRNHLNETITEFHLNFKAGKSTQSMFSAEVWVRNIRIIRKPFLERERKFNVCQNMIVDNLENPMILEHLLYYMLLGTEHFYIFDNSKRPPPSDFGLSQLKPFLDANIVSLIHFPYTHPVHWSFIQRVAGNVHYRIHGDVCEWSGHIDEDEFLLPHASLWNKPEMPPSGSLSGLLLKLLKNKEGNIPKFPGVMMDTIEMGCVSPLEKNVDMSANNLQFSNRKSSFLIDCTTRGRHFPEMQLGHGKMFVKIKNLQVQAFLSPHRITDYEVVWGGEKDAGVFFHFDEYKYAAGYKAYVQDSNLRKLILLLLKNLLGVEEDTSVDIVHSTNTVTTSTENVGVITTGVIPDGSLLNRQRLRRASADKF